MKVIKIPKKRLMVFWIVNNKEITMVTNSYYKFESEMACESCGEIHSPNVECRDSQGESIDEIFFD